MSRADGPTGAGAERNADAASISPNGRYVAFHSVAHNLSTADNDLYQDVFLRDTVSGATTLVSFTENNTASNGASYFPSVSADGRFVAFSSDADNLIPVGDDNLVTNVFVRDLQANTTGLVSVTNPPPGGGFVAGGDGSSFGASISSDGRYVAFQSDADNLSPVDEGVADVFVRDLVDGTTTLVSLAEGNLVGGDGDSFSPSISADGRFVAFSSDADNLSGGYDTNVTNVFVRDLQENTTSLVSLTSTPPGGGIVAGGDGDSAQPSISANGRFVAFWSDANNLSDGDDNDFTNVFVHDALAATTTLASTTFGSDGDSTMPEISPDGRYVAFESNVDGLSDDDNNTVINVFVRDTVAGTTTLVSHNNFIGADAHSLAPTISAGGRFVAFHSAASNLTLEESDAFVDVFHRDVFGVAPQCSNVAQSVAHGSSTVVALSCTDGDGDAITRSIVSGPAHGALGPVDQADGTVTYTPDPGYAGPDSFSFGAADATGASAAATASLTVAGLPPGPGSGRCANLLQGSRRGEVLNGTSAGDRILGLGGNDVLNGRLGDDCLSGGGGNDRISGGSGKDTVVGGAGNDKLTGGRAKDAFNAGAGNDTLNSADGTRELVRCGGGRDKVKADRADRLSGCERVTRV